MNKGFSIIIPSWNNLACLQFLLESIKKNSAYDHQIIVHVQEGTDGTLDWVKSQGIEHTHSPENTGVCSGVNKGASLATRDWICPTDDDMYFYPNWDKAFHDFYVQNSMPDLTWMTACLVEPRPSIFPTFIIKDYGDSPSDFNEHRALSEMESIKHKSHHTHNGGSPTLIYRAHFESVGGYDTDFDPAPGAEEGLSKRLYDKGCRNFVAVKDCLAYHFGSMTNRRQNNIPKKDSNRTFYNKYGMIIKEFSSLIGKESVWHKQANEPPKNEDA
jgi:glycosyltransferase involved in cell wall biosynthesis